MSYGPFICGLIIGLIIVLIFWAITNNHNNRYNQDAEIHVPIAIPRIVRHDFRFPMVDVEDIIMPARADDETPEQFFDRVQQHDDNSQNAHDRQIRVSLTNRLKAIMDKNTLAVSEPAKLKSIHEQTYSEIINLVNTSITDIESKRQIMSVLHNMMSSKNTIQMIDGVHFETNILAHVWMRINADENAENKHNLCEALIAALLDCYDHDDGVDDLIGALNLITGPGTNTVCINGRVGRILSIFTLLDADKNIAQPEMDAFEIRNEILMKALAILKRELATTSIAHVYEADPKTLSDSERIELSKFEESVKIAITDEIKNEYKDILDRNTLQEHIDTALLGI